MWHHIYKYGCSQEGCLVTWDYHLTKQPVLSYYFLLSDQVADTPLRLLNVSSSIPNCKHFPNASSQKEPKLLHCDNIRSFRITGFDFYPQQTAVNNSSGLLQGFDLGLNSVSVHLATANVIKKHLAWSRDNGKSFLPTES